MNEWKISMSGEAARTMGVGVFNVIALFFALILWHLYHQVKLKHCAAKLSLLCQINWNPRCATTKWAKNYFEELIWQFTEVSGVETRCEAHKNWCWMSFNHLAMAPLSTSIRNSLSRFSSLLKMTSSRVVVVAVSVLNLLRWHYGKGNERLACVLLFCMSRHLQISREKSCFLR